MKTARPLSLAIAVGVLALAVAGVANNRQANPATKSPTQEVPEYFDIPVSIYAPFEPIPVKGDDGKWYIIYELLLSNWAHVDLTLKKVVIEDSERETLLVSYDEEGLNHGYRFRPLPTPLGGLKGLQLRRIPAGQTSALFVGFTMAKMENALKDLRHQFTFEPSSPIKILRGFRPSESADLVLKDFHVSVSADKPVLIGPPLRGGQWKASGATDNDSMHQHQTTLTVKGGRALIAERFAIDFQKIDVHGDILPSPFPDEITNKMFYGYGEEILAVADSVVAFVKDGIPENVPQANGSMKHAVPMTFDTVAGNVVSLKLDEHRYAQYAHIQPGSIRLKVGDRVRKGQVIGLVGNAGNSVGPHLHFQVGDTEILNSSEGIPFVIDSFEVMGHWAADYQPSPWQRGGSPHRGESLLQNTVVRFP